MHDPIKIVAAWHEAVNSGDTERLASLVTDDVELGRPHGTGHGLALMVDWVKRTGIHLEPVVWYRRDDTIVAGQNASWRTGDGQPGKPREAASAFVVRNGRIESVVRFDDLAGAFAAVGLDEADRSRR